MNSHDSILHLQRTIGNQAVQRLVLTTTNAKGIDPAKSRVFQPKLRTSQPGDVYEQEADRVAGQVMRMVKPMMSEEKEKVQTKLLAPQISPLMQRQAQRPVEEGERESLPVTFPTQPQMEDENKEAIHAAPLSNGIVQLSCSDCEIEQQEEQENPAVMLQRNFAHYLLHGTHDEDQQVQAKVRESSTPSVRASLASDIHALTHGGSPLPKATRDFFEPRFGADFSQVRVHTDARSTGAAKSINAKAFTFGQNIVFGAGLYQPNTQEGQHLLAHELTHTIQQAGVRAALQSESLSSQPSDPLEREAEVIAEEPAGHMKLSSSSSERLASCPPTLRTSPMVQGAWYDVFVEGGEAAWEGAKWVGGKVAAGAEAALEGAKWVGGKVAEEAMRIGGAIWECAKMVGRPIGDLLTLNVPSLYELLGIPKPAEGTPIGTLDIVIGIFRHACLRMIPGYPLLAGAVRNLQRIHSFLKGA